MNQEIEDVIEGQRFPRAKNVGCYLCGRRPGARKFSVRFGMQVSIAECPDCRLAFQTPQPSEEASLAYMNWRWRCADNYVGDRADQMERAQRELGQVQQCLDRPGRLLDFGAGAGSFVRAALDQGWDATGLEQSESARARAREFYQVELRTDFGAEQYEAVTMWDVIEHLREPEAVLRMIGGHLADHGLIFIETGNFENWRRVVDADQWGLYLFDHQFYWTPSSLKEVLRRAGFEEFRLLDCNRTRPSLVLDRIVRRPLDTVRSWLEWRRARRAWPDHGDINLMVAVGRKSKHPA